ncbi:RCC1 domain-containing protein [Cohnella abietis]|uniref:SLH domain-containing protein n=1 Tax=Cohnella abietis TaxID=2507935 RepID=A0A3T1DFC9_9BACL|nr:S-layer homology domain-containing protein [Cohnella abietis]BBI36678.1 hypothetical protein KCTCHS21_60770 [Cohnella abietis]
MLSFNWRRVVCLVLGLVLLFSTIVPFDIRSVYAAHKGVGSWEGVRVSAGEFHSLALKADGTVVAWGSNDDGQIKVPVGLKDVVSISAGWKHSMVLKSNGTVVAWGENIKGQVDVPVGLKDVVSISAGRQHSLALKTDGTVVAWGSNDDGQVSVPTGLKDVVSISAGRQHSLALKTDGTVVAWGSNNLNQLKIPVGLKNVVSISAGTYHSLALKSDGTVIAWGSNNDHQLEVPVDLKDVVSISAGDKHSLALKSDGTVIGWGANADGQLNMPVDLSGVMSISTGWNHSLALKSDGTVVAWGDIRKGKTIVPASLASPIKGKQIAAGFAYSLALKSDGTVAAWGIDGDGQAVMVPDGLKDVVSIAAGTYHSMALKSDGTVVAWGKDFGGQITVPVGLTGVVAIAVGDYHSLALKSDGTVVAWGNNTDDQLSVPSGLKDVVSISAGRHHSMALKSDGTVVAWGKNADGQVSVPDGLKDIVAIAAGATYSLALKSDGTVVAWGSNYHGQRSVPAGLNGVVSITAGWYHSLALKSDGTIVGWGLNDSGQLNVPGNAKLSGLTLQEGNFTEPFNPSVTSYTYYYNGHSLSSVKVTPTLASTNQTVMYVNNELLSNGSTKTINIAGAIKDTVIPVRVEPYLLPGQTYTITLAIDSTPPNVQFGTNGRVVAAKTAASNVTVSDTQSGVDAASLQYVWTQSTAVPTSGWLTFSDLDTLRQTSGNGNWYLHIRATDKVGNVANVVSKPFLLDQTSPPTVTISSSASGTVNAAFQATITFSEGVNGFTSDDLVVVNGTASNFVSVNPATYTATITPITNGQAVTVVVGAAAAADATGIFNTASNTLSLLYDKTKPVVNFGGFINHQQFATPPTEVSVSVSEAVYWIAGGAQLTAANALPLISMKKDGVGFSAYTPIYDEPSQTFTLSFNGTLDDGVYEVDVAGNVVKNANQNTLDVANASFIVAVPVVASISASSVSLPSAGGIATATITGANLTGQSLKVYVDGVEAATATVSSDTSAVATVTLPYNTAQTVKNHIFTVYLNGVEVTGQASTVTVSAEPPSTVAISSDAELVKLNVSTSSKELGLSPAFTPKTTDYKVETDAEQVELQLGPAHSKAIIKLRGKRIGETTTVPLTVGTNVLVITVQAEDGTIKTYTVTIHRNAGTNNNVPKACTFTDVQSHWAEAEICEAAELGIVVGVNADTFMPNGYVTRTEFAIMLLRALRIDIINEASDLPFSDKSSIPEWARLATQTAVAKGILDGYSEGTLRPMQTVKRTEIAAMVSKALKWKADGTKSLAFSDESSIPAWARAYVKAACERGILVGRACNQFVPDGVTTRAEATVVLLRLWKVLQ